jgi:hypothetical protein
MAKSIEGLRETAGEVTREALGVLKAELLAEDLAFSWSAK